MRTVSGWESGEYAPGGDKLVALCDLFGITLDEIFGENETKKAPDNIIESKCADFIKLLDKM